MEEMRGRRRVFTETGLYGLVSKVGGQPGSFAFLLRDLFRSDAHTSCEKTQLEGGKERIER